VIFSKDSTQFKVTEARWERKEGEKTNKYVSNQTESPYTRHLERRRTSKWIK
jgi:hypothetical protein